MTAAEVQDICQRLAVLESKVVAMHETISANGLESRLRGVEVGQARLVGLWSLNFIALLGAIGVQFVK